MKRLLLPLIISLAATAHGQEEQRFLFYLSGQPFGEERMHSYELGDTLILDGMTMLGTPANTQMRARTVLRAPDDTLIDYLCWTEDGDSMFLLARADSVLIGKDSRRVQYEQNWFVGDSKALPLDNAIAQHIWLLARQLARDPEGKQSILALIPQQIQASALERIDVESREGRLDGETIPVTTHVVHLACVRNELDLSEDGRFLGMNVPTQAFEIRIPGYERIQEDKGGPAVPEEELTLQSKAGNILGASLALPADLGAPVPACIILHDAGAMDRNLSYGPNKIYAQLARGLAERGIASLRYDKRTFVIARETQEKTYGPDITLNEAVLEDGIVAFHHLLADERFDPERLFILGHGLGGAAAPSVSRLLGEEGIEPAGLVMLAPPGRDLLSVYIDQYRYLNSLGCLDDTTLGKFENYARDMAAGAVPETSIVFFATPYYWDSMLYWYPWDEYQQQSAPALILFGERDHQITAEDRKTWTELLASDRRAASRSVSFPSYNHHFLPGSGTPGPAELGKRGHLEPEFLDEIALWMKSLTP